MFALLEAFFQVHALLCSFHILQTLLLRLLLMELVICVLKAHVVNTGNPILSEVTDKEVSLLFCGL